jgi:hypothetical protein
MALPDLISGPIWRFCIDPRVSARMDRNLKKGLNVTGIQKSMKSWMKCKINHCRKVTEIVADISTFIPPRVIFPADCFAPDWFTFGGYHFCSSKMADALAQPEEVIQYLPITFDSDNEIAKSKNYQIARIIVHQRAIDLKISDYEACFERGYDTNILYFGISLIRKYTILDGFTAMTELFRETEDPIKHIFATDRLAERVLKAKCIGLQFISLDTPSYFDGSPFTVRTARGTKVLTR